MRFLYKPFGLMMGILAGLLGKRIFDFVWSKIDDQEPPEATTEQSQLRKVLISAALQGAIFKATRAAVDRAGAKGFSNVTGVWPGEKVPDPE
jgi:hypothetical protein